MDSWTHPKSILVATNLTDIERLLPCAKAQAKQTGAILWLVHVVEESVYGTVMSGVNPSVPEEVAFRNAQSVLADAVAGLRRANFMCMYEVFRLPIADQIAAFIKEKKIDRLIQGTSGKGRLGKLLLGSVAEMMIRTLDIPVCTIGPKVKWDSSPVLRTVLFATSLRHLSELCPQLTLAHALAHDAEAHVCILHVLESDADRTTEVSSAVEAMDTLVGYERQGCAESHLLVRLGDPTEEILREVAELKPIALVLGVEPASDLASVIRPGTAYEMIARASCPVFTLKDA